ncbi:hypothetical protein [Chitinophaga sp.]|uniref:hypothetical protein n=1 Tax=Chitinophaga sp. TaxID=1869181 RepID=UPI0031E276C0
MKKVLTLVLLFCSSTVFSQVGIKGYFFFQYPSQNIFYHPFDLEGKSSNTDPFTVEGSLSNVLAAGDLETSKSLLSQEMSFGQVTSNSIASTYSKSDSVVVTGSFRGVRTVTLKQEAYSKIKDGSYHVIQALKADSVYIKIRSLKKTGFGTLDAQKIVLGLTGAGTAVQIIGKTLGLDSRALFQHSRVTNDSLVFIVNDPDIYFAARFLKFDEQLQDQSGVSFIGYIINKSIKRLAAPDCEAREPLKDFVVELKGSRNPVVQQLLSCDKKSNSRLFLVYDTITKYGQVMLSNSQGGGDRPDTTKSEIYDFESFRNTNLTASLFVFNRYNTANHSSNYICADYDLQLDPTTNKLTMYNRANQKPNGLARTCIYNTNSKLKFWPVR